MNKEEFKVLIKNNIQSISFSFFEKKKKVCFVFSSKYEKLLN